MSLDWQVIERYFPFLLRGAWLTLRLTVITTAPGTIIGLFAALARLSRFKIFSWPAAAYVDFFRGTPSVGWQQVAGLLAAGGRKRRPVSEFSQKTILNKRGLLP